MAQIREIRKRIKAVANIKRITRTMQMIAAAKFAQSQHRATATKPYTDGVFELVRELAATAGDLDHPLISGPPRSKDAAPPEVTLIITSDRGLCGPYNGQVLRTFSAHRHDSEKARAGRSELIGRKGVNYLKFHRIPVDTSHSFGDKPSFEEVERLAQRYMDQFLAGEIACVNVIYMSFISAGRQAPRLLQLLPLKPPPSEGETATGPRAVYDFSPSATELLDDLLPTAVKTTLFQCLIEAIASEHAARMVAMKAATDNAGKMGKELTRKFNRARQSQITTELTEIISGAAALE
jgi:F-type H+-transporting ATPase subunit gamma